MASVKKMMIKGGVEGGGRDTERKERGKRVEGKEGMKGREKREKRRED